MTNLTHKPFFSVIIPLYNKEKHIRNTLKSVLNQSFQDFEVVIVDDGSSDKSLKLAHEFQDSRITIIEQKNQGVSAARNTGIVAANSKYISLLDADDYWEMNHLFELKKQIDLFPEAGLYCNNYKIFYSDKTLRPANINLDFKDDCLIVDDFFKASITNSVAWTSAVGFSKEKFNAVGGFDLNLKTAQDLDLWIKMALKYEVAFNPEITMTYNLHVDDSLSKNEFNNLRYQFISSYQKDEKSNPSLKLYLDVNRYALAVRTRINNENKLSKKVIDEIDLSNLNYKQKIILNLPKLILIFIKRIQTILKENNIYFTAYK